MDRNVYNQFGQKVPDVATREGGVDRNIQPVGIMFSTGMSPPARVAWIETCFPCSRTKWNTVATREGGVDRNLSNRLMWCSSMPSPPARVAWIETILRISFSAPASGRHPRGWRG